MLRNIHFFNIKSGADEARMLSLMDHELAEYAKTFGCLERKTWKLLDARAAGEPVQAATYMNESLWPSRKEADAFTKAKRPADVMEWWSELVVGTEIVKTVRYLDAGG
jgi:hypothetical protein